MNKPPFSRDLASRMLQHYSIASRLGYHCNMTCSFRVYAKHLSRKFDPDRMLSTLTLSPQIGSTGATNT